MRVNKTYRDLLDKSISSMLSAIEIYNKPNFMYREELFAILSVNSWELLLKAYLLRLNKYNLNSIYELEVVKKKDGTPSTRKKPSLNRCNNPKSISIFKIMNELEGKNRLTSNLRANIDAIIEIRDNAIHFVNSAPITKQIQELGFANIKNYISIIKKWGLEIDISSYNFYLMPLAYVDSKIEAESILTSEMENYIDFIKARIEDKNDMEFDISISINIDFKKGNSFGSLGMKHDPNGMPVNITEEDNRKKFPLTHGEIVSRCRTRYSDFKQNQDFNNRMKDIKKNNKLCYNRRLDSHNPQSQSKWFYSSNIWKELDAHYTKNK